MDRGRGGRGRAGLNPGVCTPARRRGVCIAVPPPGTLRPWVSFGFGYGPNGAARPVGSAQSCSSHLREALRSRRAGRAPDRHRIRACAGGESRIGRDRQRQHVRWRARNKPASYAPRRCVSWRASIESPFVVDHGMSGGAAVYRVHNGKLDHASRHRSRDWERRVRTTDPAHALHPRIHAGRLAAPTAPTRSTITPRNGGDHRVASGHHDHRRTCVREEGPRSADRYRDPIRCALALAGGRNRRSSRGGPVASVRPGAPSTSLRHSNGDIPNPSLSHRSGPPPPRRG